MTPLSRFLASKLIILAAVLLTSCATTADNPPVAWQTVEIANGCVVNAHGYQAAYDAMASQKPWFWSRVLMIRFNELPRAERTGPNSHALCVVQWQAAIWAYDQQWGSRKLSIDPAAKDDPEYLARQWLGPDKPFLTAFFVESPVALPRVRTEEAELNLETRNPETP